MRGYQICIQNRLVVAVFIFLSLFAFCKQNAVAYTADTPVLYPANSLLVTGTPQPFAFSTANTTISRIKTYHAEFTFTKGLNISNISATPTATTMTINTKQNKIIFEWTDIAPGTTLIGNFTAASLTSAIYQIIPAKIYYTDYNRKTYTASCNTATITFRSELIPPLAPRQLSSIQGEGNIMLSWKYNTEPDLLGYNVYRSSDAISFTKIGSIQSSSFTDTAVQANTTYYYRVTAYDIAGNESDFSPVTAETYFDLKLRTITATGVQAAVFGDINADGKIDIAIGYPDAIVGVRKNAKAAGKVEIYLGGNTTNIPDVVIPGENDKDDFGYSLAVADLDGDGYDDLIVGAPSFSPYLTWPVIGEAPGAGKIYVFRGGPQFGSTPVLSINGQWSIGCNGGCYYMLQAEEFGYSMSPVGDINGDGYQDIAIGAPMGGMDRSGTVKILLGGPYLEALSILEIDGKVYSELMGQSLAAAGDINKDGFADIIAAAPTDKPYNTWGKVYVILGGQQPSIFTSMWAGVKNFGYSVAGLDFNNDGNMDVASSSSSGIFLYYGWPLESSIADVVISEGLQKLFTLNGLTADGYDALLTEGFSIYYGNLLGETIADIVRNGVRVIGTDSRAAQSGENLLVADSTRLYEYTLAPYLSLAQITLTSPLRNMTVTEQMLNIAGGISGPTSQLLIQGRPVTVMSDGSFSTNILLDENSNTIELIVIAPDNRISKRTLSVTYVHLDPLILTIAMPSDNEVVNASPIQVTGTVSNNASVAVNGIQATLNGSVFTANVPLGEGQNVITASATDQYGRTASKSISVTLQTKGSVQGTVTESTTGQPLPGVTVMVTDSIASQTVITDSIGRYTVADVAAGAFSISFSKTGYLPDTQSGSATAGTIAVLDAQLQRVPALTVAILSPQDGTVISSSPVSVTGTVTNNASVTINGNTASVAANSFTASAPLIEGTNTITATATDQYGQTASQSITVTLALPKPPQISNISANNITSDSAIISWTTDQPSDSLVEYGETTAYGNTASDAILVTSHTITLNNLSPDKTYHFKVTSRNADSLSSSSGDNTFVTLIFRATTIGDFGNVTVMEVNGNYDARTSDGSINALPRQEIAKEFLRSHPDQYDFMVIISNFDFAMPQAGAKAFYLEVKNDVQGTGKQLVDNSAFFGSSGRLQGMIDMGNMVTLGLSPFDQTRFEQTIDTLAHEQMHRWGAEVRFRDTGGNISFALLGKDSTHWSYLLDSDGSLMYGNDWKDNGDGTFTSVSASKYYSPLDLYLMGFYDKTQVPRMLLIENSSIDPTGLPAIGATVSGTPRQIIIDDIIAAEGERIPNASSSQKAFKTAFIFITTPGTFTGNEIQGMENIRNAYAGRFAELTYGKGSIADVPPSLSIMITSPSAGATISSPDVMLKGTIINSTGNETGVTVNGMVATVYGNQFIANHVPLTEGANTITITATDTTGNTATASINVNAVTTGNYIRSSSNIESGIAPLEVVLRIDGSFSIASSNLNITGPVQPEVLSSAPEEYKLRFTAEGVYYVTATATGPDGLTYQDAVAITVLNKTQIDKLLKAKWEGMKGALLSGDIEKSVSYFVSPSQARYRQKFVGLSFTQINSIFSSVVEFRVDSLIDATAECSALRFEIGDVYSYPVTFVSDGNGIWKIMGF